MVLGLSLMAPCPCGVSLPAHTQQNDKSGLPQTQSAISIFVWEFNVKEKVSTPVFS